MPGSGAAIRRVDCQPHGEARHRPTAPATTARRARATRTGPGARAVGGARWSGIAARARPVRAQRLSRRVPASAARGRGAAVAVRRARAGRRPNDGDAVDGTTVTRTFTVHVAATRVRRRFAVPATIRRAGVTLFADYDRRAGRSPTPLGTLARGVCIALYNCIAPHKTSMRDDATNKAGFAGERCATPGLGARRRARRPAAARSPRPRGRGRRGDDRFAPPPSGEPRPTCAPGIDRDLADHGRADRERAH